jgi:hypothetical protein
MKRKQAKNTHSLNSLDNKEKREIMIKKECERDAYFLESTDEW